MFNSALFANLFHCATELTSLKVGNNTMEGYFLLLVFVMIMLMAKINLAQMQMTVMVKINLAQMQTMVMVKINLELYHNLKTTAYK